MMIVSKYAYEASIIENQRKLDEELSKIDVEIEICQEETDKKLNKVKEHLSMSPVPYALYVYQKELKRSKLNIVRLSQAKIELTDNLVVATVDNIHECLDRGVSGKVFQRELGVLSREVMYTKKLQKRIINLRKCFKKIQQRKINRKRAQKSTKEKQHKVSNQQIETTEKTLPKNHADVFDFYN